MFITLWLACSTPDVKPSPAADTPSSESEDDDPTAETLTGTDTTSDTDDTDDTDTIPLTRTPCGGGTSFPWTADGSGPLVAFPSEVYTTPDTSSPTGFRVAIQDTDWFDELPPIGQTTMGQAEGASGFARLGKVLLRVRGDLGAIPSEAHLRFVDLDTGASVPYAAELVDEGRLLAVQPLLPLAPGHAHAVVLSSEHLAADGACVEPSAALFAALQDELADVPDAVDLGTDEISAVTRFVVGQDDLAMQDAVADVRARTWTWDLEPTCVSYTTYRQCTGRLDGADYRVAGGVVADVPQDTWAPWVDLYLPHGNGPFPVVLYGHGLEGQRSNAAYLAADMASLDVALVAIDALHHGEHPSRGGGLPSLNFLGIELLPDVAIDTAAVRGNFDQTALDWLQLLKLLNDDPVVSGTTLDLSRVGYHGDSLGGVLGPSVSAGSPEVDALVLALAGGHFMEFVVGMESYGISVESVLKPLLGGDEGWYLFQAVGQVAMDGSDPANYGFHATVDRWDGGVGPHVLHPTATQDEIIPPAAGQALARAMDLPHVDPVSTVELLDVTSAPVSANQGGATRGYVQLDTPPATHFSALTSDELQDQAITFWATWADDGVPTIVAP